MSSWPDAVSAHVSAHPVRGALVNPGRFAKVVFIVAGIWGIVVLTPLFFLVDVTGRP
jgi:hypothetical protein